MVAPYKIDRAKQIMQSKIELPLASFRNRIRNLDINWAYRIYLLSISIIGMGFVFWGLFNFQSYSPKLTLLLLLLLSAVAASVSTSATLANSGFVYGIQSAVSIAAVPSFGIGSACLVVATYEACIWLIKTRTEEKPTRWKKSWSQLIFNIGMHSISIAFAGTIWMGVAAVVATNPPLAMILPWLPAAFTYEIVNFWILVGILRLQQGAELDPLRLWQDDLWATQMGVLITAFGGGVLALAISRYDSIGTIIFFLPILVSAFALRLYVQQMQTLLNNQEQIIAERTQEVTELTKQKYEFLSVMTHDMITPLTSIQLYAEAIQNKPEHFLSDPLMGKHLLRSQKTLLGIVRNILDLERLRSGAELPLQKSQFKLGELIDNVLIIVEAEATSNQISLMQDVEPADIVIKADQQYMERVLLNLASNAVKYTPTGGHVSITARKMENTVQISIADTGIGIPKDELSTIFERFERVEEHLTKAQGIGLGLMISRFLVERHGGEIQVKSEEGKGSTFTIILPIEACREDK